MRELGIEMTLESARAQWVAGHGLLETRSGEEAISRAGWLHAIGGADIYVSALMRTDATDRLLLDGPIQRDALRVVPGARGCTMLVPQADAELAIALSTHLNASKQARERDKLGIADGEIAGLGTQILEALEAGPAHTAELRKRLPDGAARSLGDAGKKLGVSSTLPMALRQLEAEGRLARCPHGGRLDVERYDWRRNPSPGPFPDDLTALVGEVGRRYFAHAGPATIKDFAAWSGLSQRDAKLAFGSLDLVAVELDGRKGLHYVLEEHADRMTKPALADHRPVLAGMRDPYWDHRDGLDAVVEARHMEIEASMGRSRKTLAKSNRLWQRGVLVGGIISGFWEMDEEAGRPEVGLFDPPSKELRAQIEPVADRVGTFLRDSLGHARVYAMEPKNTRAYSLEVVRDLHVL